MKVSASKLRQDIYRILDQIIESGDSIEIERNGVLLEIRPVQQQFRKIGRLKKRQLTEEDSENFVHLDWSGEWGELKKSPRGKSGK